MGGELNETSTPKRRCECFHRRNISIQYLTLSDVDLELDINSDLDLICDCDTSSRLGDTSHLAVTLTLT